MASKRPDEGTKALKNFAKMQMPALFAGYAANKPGEKRRPGLSAKRAEGVRPAPCKGDC